MLFYATLSCTRHALPALLGSDRLAITARPPLETPHTHAFQPEEMTNAFRPKENLCYRIASSASLPLLHYPSSLTLPSNPLDHLSRTPTSPSYRHPPQAPTPPHPLRNPRHDLFPIPAQHLVQATARRLDEAAEALRDLLSLGRPDKVVGGDVDEGMLVSRRSGLVVVLRSCFTSGGREGCRGLLKNIYAGGGGGGTERRREGVWVREGGWYLDVPFG